MHAFMIVLRLLHIVLGVFWAGTIFFLVLFLGPTVRTVGPEGAPVMHELIRRRFLDVMPVVAVLTILSGLALYWRLSGGMAADWVGSPFGLSLTIGGIASILALIVGVFGVRSATLGAVHLSAAAAAASDTQERERMQAEVQRLRLRSAASARWVGVLLLIAVVTMAVARYL